MSVYWVFLLFISFSLARQNEDCTVFQQRTLSNSITRLIVNNPFGGVQISHNGEAQDKIQFYTTRQNPYTSELTVEGDTIQLVVKKQETESENSSSNASSLLSSKVFFMNIFFIAFLRYFRTHFILLCVIFFVAFPLIEGDCSIPNVQVIIPPNFQFCNITVASTEGTTSTSNQQCGLFCVNSPKCISELPSRYTNCRMLSARQNVYLYWTIQGQTLSAAFKADSLGWIGLGFSADGTMPSYGFGGSDVIVGWVKNDGTCDNGCVRDYLATQRQLPTLDTSQDVTLVRGWEEEGSTIIEFTRSLNTGDFSDRVIDPNSPIPIIWALNSQIDPEGSSFTRHDFNQLASEKMNLTLSMSSSCGILASTTGAFSTTGAPVDVCQPPVCSISEYRLVNFSVPTVSTTYACFGITLSNTTRDIFEFEPIADTVLLHHVLLYKIDSPVSESVHACDMGLLRQPIWGYAPGGSSFSLPSDTGVRIGSSGIKYMVVEFHFDNPQALSRYFDNSGVRIYLTSQLRPKVAGVVTTSPPFVNINIPPQNPSYHVSGLCSHDVFTDICLQPNETLEIIIYSPHAHYLGRQVWGDIIRDGEVIRQIGNWNFAFDEQSIYNLENPLILKQGDEIRTHCIYDSTSRNATTRYGESSRAEMCYMFWMYARETPLPLQCAYCLGYQS